MPENKEPPSTYSSTIRILWFVGSSASQKMAWKGELNGMNLGFLIFNAKRYYYFEQASPNKSMLPGNSLLGFTAAYQKHLFSLLLPLFPRARPYL